MTVPTQMDLQFMGAKPGYVRGSMAAASRVVSLGTLNHRFRVGDRVIVEVGGEAGAGAVRTVGVGGTYPVHSFATEAALLASGAPAWSTTTGDPVAYAQDTGRVARYDGGWSFSYGGSPLPYWARWFLPRALEAVVDDVDGATLTLSAAAAVSTSNARIWYDNRDVLEQAFLSHQGNVRVPDSADRYAIGSRINTGGGLAVDDFLVYGDSNTGSRLYQPLGCMALWLQLHDAADARVQDLELERSWIDGYGIWNGYDGYNPNYQAILSMNGISAHRPSFLRLRTVNGLWSECQMSLCSNGAIRSCEIVRTLPARQYVSWALQLADCDTCVIDDCSFDSDWMGEAAEIFKGVNCSITGLRARNGITASNSNANPMHEDWVLRYTAGSMAARLAADPSYVAKVYAINHNNNFLLPTAEGGYWRNIQIIEEGPVGGAGLEGYAHHSALPAGGDPFTIGPDVTMTLAGGGRAVVEESGSPTADVIIDGLTADTLVRLYHGSVANTAVPELRYCGDHVTLGSGNVIPIQTDECA